MTEQEKNIALAIAVLLQPFDENARRRIKEQAGRDLVTVATFKPSEGERQPIERRMTNGVVYGSPPLSGD
jgi:hypothetical protein